MQAIRFSAAFFPEEKGNLFLSYSSIPYGMNEKRLHLIDATSKALAALIFTSLADARASRYAGSK